MLPDYCRDTNAVLFIDDAHKLAGRKLEIARLCVMASKIHVIAASEEQHIPPVMQPAAVKLCKALCSISFTLNQTNPLVRKWPRQE